MALELLANALDERHGVRHAVRGEVVGERSVTPQGLACVEDRHRVQTCPGLRAHAHAEVAPMAVEVGKDVVHHEHGAELSADVCGPMFLALACISLEPRNVVGNMR